MTNKTHLIIGDAHARPGISNDRFSWLGSLVAELRPDVIVDIGDWEDMPSLSSYDLGKKSYEGRRYKKDLEAAWDAREKFITPLREYNKKQAKKKEKLYRPTMYALGGNHFEGRIKKAIELSAMLEGTISVEDGRHEEFGWDYVPFLEPLYVDGICYQHYFTSGIMGRPIAGEHPAYSLLSKQHTSCVQGHSHLLDLAVRTKPNGDTIWGIHAGCYLAPDQWEDYAGPANRMWRKGVLFLSGVKNGSLDSFSWFGIDDIRNTYDSHS